MPFREKNTLNHQNLQGNQSQKLLTNNERFLKQISKKASQQNTSKTHKRVASKKFNTIIAVVPTSGRNSPSRLETGCSSTKKKRSSGRQDKGSSNGFHTKKKSVQNQSQQNLVEMPVGECLDKFKKYQNNRLYKVIEEAVPEDRQNTDDYCRGFSVQADTLRSCE